MMTTVCWLAVAVMNFVNRVQSVVVVCYDVESTALCLLSGITREALKDHNLVLNLLLSFWDMFCSVSPRKSTTYIVDVHRNVRVGGQACRCVNFVWEYLVSFLNHRTNRLLAFIFIYMFSSICCFRRIV